MIKCGKYIVHVESQKRVILASIECTLRDKPRPNRKC